MPGCVNRFMPLPEAFAPNKKLDCLRSSAAWEAFLDYFDQFGTVDRLWDNAMFFNATSIPGFLESLKFRGNPVMRPSLQFCRGKPDTSAGRCPRGRR
jgi:hypothetical protein